jgi:hypothetical protein
VLGFGERARAKDLLQKSPIMPHNFPQRQQLRACVGCRRRKECVLMHSMIVQLKVYDNCELAATKAFLPKSIKELLLLVCMAFFDKTIKFNGSNEETFPFKGSSSTIIDN